MNSKTVDPRTGKISTPILSPILPAENSMHQTTNGATESSAIRFAPDWPGIPARWTSSAKTGVGTALSNQSR
ncbi:MAG: hypothetical protein ABI318_11145, partial [Chthoniobacteraceae bacterium]